MTFRVTIQVGLLLLLVAADVRAAEAWSAKIAELTGIARTRTPRATEWSAISVGGALGPGDTLLTLSGARARLTFSDGTKVTLGPETRLVVTPADGGKRRVALLRGFARFVAAKLGQDADELTVVTPTAVAAVKGTEFTLGVTESVTDIAVVEGEVLCADRERRYAVLMRAGETARWDRNGLWEPVRRTDDDASSADDPESGGGGGADAPAAAGALPAGLRLGGYVTGGYRVLRGPRGLSQPWLGLSPLSPVEGTRGQSRSSFDAPWTSLTADSPLGPRAHTFWEIWISGGGRNQFPGSDDAHGRIELLQGWAQADLIAPADAPPLVSVRAGVIPVPVGVLGSDTALPRRTFTSFPIWAIRAVPVPWQDAGAEISGGLPAGPLVVRWQAALVNGLQIEPYDSWQAPRLAMDGLWWARPSEDERSLGRDNNRNKAVAGRIGIGWGTGSGIGASAYRGRADSTNTMGVQLGAADLTLALDLKPARIRLRAEAGHAMLTRGPAGFLPSFPEQGGYAELEVTPRAWPVSLGVGGSRAGAASSGGSRVTETYAAIAWRFVPKMVFKLEGRQFAFSGGGPTVDVLAAQMSAFW